MTRLTERLVPSDRPESNRAGKPGGSELGYVDSVTSLPPVLIERARRAVAARAASAKDARLLLDALGILKPATPAPEPAPSDCDPAMPPSRIPAYVQVNAHTETYDGRHITNVPTKGLL